MSTETNKTESGATRVGVYVCHCGGNISDVVDVEAVAGSAGDLSDVVVARHEMFMCSDPGQSLVAKDIEELGLTRVVVAACSPSLHELTFRGAIERTGMNPFLYEHANIREQVSWCAKSNAKGATVKAKGLVAAAVAKARRLDPLQPIRVDSKRHVAVVGGGVGGMRSALDLARRGLEVTLLERSPFLGGNMARLHTVYPTEERARDLLQDLVAQVTKHPNITVHTGAEVVRTSGYIGNFLVEVKLHPRGITEDFDPATLDEVLASCPEVCPSEFDYGISQRKAIYFPFPGASPPIPAIDWDTCTNCGACVEAAGGRGISLDDKPRSAGLDVGAIVLATGFEPYEPSEGEYEYGHPRVVTLPQLVRMLDPEGPTGGKLEVEGGAVRSVSFIHCVGSRQVEGIHEPGPDGRVNDYCSRVCCTAALQAACEIRDRFPDVNVYDFYQDIRTYGRGQETYYEDASRKGVIFFRWLPTSPPVVEKAPDGERSPLSVKVEDTLTLGEEVRVASDLVVLAVGMIPRNIEALVEMLKLPRSADRFLQEVHPKLRPVELSVGGVMIAGTCQAPMDITESCAAAGAAAAKVSSMLAAGHIALDPFVATVDEETCTGGESCDQVCLEECSALEAISMQEVQVGGQTKTVARVNAALCNGCGMCVAVCPFRAIQVAGWRLGQFEAMVDAIASVGA